ncbi:hypothetical protein LJC34_05945 [Oscillospiraceae bacterium OttesenSCG-928-G22]|nr:hypothetical protein [Oscillospiraceae bacterium OttesenSCG-928-G22]
MYNENAIRPFLTQPDPEAKGRFFHGKPAYIEAKDSDPEYLFHVTRMKHLSSIVQQGLCASHGGKDGAGALLAPDGRFVKQDAGWIFASSFPEVVDCYIHEYDTHADKSESDSWLNSPVLLRFKEYKCDKSEKECKCDKFEKDPAHPGAVKTRKDIGANRLEMLTFDGWESVEKNKQQILEVLEEMSAR